MMRAAFIGKRSRIVCRTYLAVGALLTGCLLLGCESDEADDLAKAQRCLDRVPQDNGASANECIQMVAKHGGQQADIIRCSGYFLVGGLTTNKILQAYKALEGDSTNKEAVFIGTLALTDVSTAKNADLYCKKTGLKGFIYLGSLAVVGTILKSAGSFSVPPTEAEVNAAMATCTATPSSCDPAAISSAAGTLADNYCSGSSKDDKVCTDINSALQAGGGDTAVVTSALTCLLNGKTFTPPSTCA